jgi:hypothetical protein
MRACSTRSPTLNEFGVFLISSAGIEAHSHKRAGTTPARIFKENQMANIWPRKCTACGETVDYNGEDAKWFGFGPCKKKIGNHIVEPVTYYHPGGKGIQDLRDRRIFAPDVILLPVYEYQAEGGKILKTHGVSAHFYDGKFETADPEQQWYLDQKGGILSGPDGLKMWREIYLTTEQNLHIQKAELEDVQRQIKEGNALLEQVKAKQGAGARP